MTGRYICRAALTHGQLGATAAPQPSAPPEAHARRDAGQAGQYPLRRVLPSPCATTRQVIGTGVPANCAPATAGRAAPEGGVVTFKRGPMPVTVTMTATAKRHKGWKQVPCVTRRLPPNEAKPDHAHA